MREIKKLFIHCSATPPEMDIGAKEIRQWHLEKGWSDIGYHGVIRRDGTLEHGRSLLIPGAHARGHNQDSIGLCLIGGITSIEKKPQANFTFEQYSALLEYKDRMFKVFGPLEIVGHNEVSNKACPCFNVKSFFNIT